MNDQQPIYDTKVKKVLEMLKFKTRDEVAKELNYKSWKGLDMYMRRKNFTYDSKKSQYIPTHTRLGKLSGDIKCYAPAKAAGIIAAFEEENPDPKLIAKQEGFRSHKEMAESMRNKGYKWNVYKNNYVKALSRSSEDEPATEGLPQEPFQGPFIKTKAEENETSKEIEKYLPFLRFLYEKREEIYQLLFGIKEDGKIPRYALPGLVRTKAIYMSDTIAKLAREFSREKNVTQREIVEAALVEYLQKYGFKREIEALFKE